MIGHDNLKGKLGLVANRIADRDIPRELRLAVRESLLALLSEQSSLSHPQMSDVWRLICQNCDLGMATLLTLASSALPGRRRQLRRLLGERVLRITVKPFMDMSTMIEERLVQCCVHVGTRSSQDQCAPFCAVQARSHARRLLRRPYFRPPALPMRRAPRSGLRRQPIRT
ncbi:hypothetical protein MGAST_06905 [Mycobacterium gastri 'Wayne']|nr:hypothetical protein MGAST_06905 [Mycobacterium gastri 'Wayne']